MEEAAAEVETLIASPAVSQARDLVMKYGHNATAYQILNPGIEYWFSIAADAVVGYVRRGAWLLVAGEPVCSPAELPGAIHDFEAFARGKHRHVCYVCAAEPMRRLLAHTGQHSSITMGAQPVWNPAEWLRVRSQRSVRLQLNRALNKHVEIEASAPAAAAQHPEIRRTLTEWLRSRRLPPMHFLVEPEVLAGVVDDRILLVARVRQRIVAFLVASPVAARNGFLIEELARSSQAPNGTSELLIDAAMERFAEAGSTWATMGLVALARGTIGDNPLWLRGLMRIARAHANRFYNFRGLERFRTKMHPAAWEKLYAISNERQFSPQALYAMGGAFSGIPPAQAIGLAILKGAREELRTMVRTCRNSRVIRAALPLAHARGSEP
jgi:phosphatidylglycerol lysyltransferase